MCEIAQSAQISVNNFWGKCKIKKWNEKFKPKKFLFGNEMIKDSAYWRFYLA